MDEFDCFFHCGKPSRENHDEPKISAAMRREIEEKEMQFEVPGSSLWEEQEECKMLHQHSKETVSATYRFVSDLLK
jgi:hypothetical protein